MILVFLRSRLSNHQVSAIGSIALDNYEEIVYEILLNDQDITNIKMGILCAEFNLYGNRYELSFSESEFDYPDVIAMSESGKSFPHFSTKIFMHSNVACRDLCLVEDETLVKSSLSFKEKIYDVLERLKKLLNLSEQEILK